MSQKKCPKCGESNPVEAVMCWACYTPLSGAIAAGAAGAALPQGGAVSEREKTKKAIPMWQIGVLGVALLCGVGYGAMSLMGGGSSEEATEIKVGPAPLPSGKSPGVSVTVPAFLSPSVSSPSVGVSASAPSVAPTAATNSAGQVRFVLGVPPKRGIPWGTMGIVPTSTVSEQDAAGMAATASRQMAKTGNWNGLFVYVFQDSQTAEKFRQYQKQRSGEPLGDDDYNSLQALWPNTLLRYDYSRGNESVRYPSKNPSGWWNGKSKFNKTRS